MAEEKKTMTSLASMGKVFDVPKELQKTAYITSMEQYEKMYQRSITDPEGFWSEAAAAILWEKRWDKLLDHSRAPFYRWFTGGVLNTCYNCLDRHVAEGRGQQAALIYDSAMTGRTQSFTYAELTDLVARFAGALQPQQCLLQVLGRA